MPDRDHTLNPAADPSPLVAALRALPGATPQPDLWPLLAQSLARRHARIRHPYRRHALWLLPPALAAALALALLLPRSASEPSGSTPVPSVATAPRAPTAAPALAPARDELASLRQRSQSLERWIAAVSAHAAQDSRDLMAAVEVEDLIGLVDVQLNATRDRADALPLWRQRIALLEDLAMIRGGGIAIAANDDGSALGAPSMLVN